MNAKHGHELTPELFQSVMNNLRNGKSVNRASELAGISRNVLNGWRRQGELELERREIGNVCKRCEGSQREKDGSEDACTACKGEGRIRRKDTAKEKYVLFHEGVIEARKVFVAQHEAAVSDAGIKRQLTTVKRFKWKDVLDEDGEVIICDETGEAKRRKVIVGETETETPGDWRASMATLTHRLKTWSNAAEVFGQVDHSHAHLHAAVDATQGKSSVLDLTLMFPRFTAEFRAELMRQVERVVEEDRMAKEGMSSGDEREEDIVTRGVIEIGAESSGGVAGRGNSLIKGKGSDRNR